MQQPHAGQKVLLSTQTPSNDWQFLKSTRCYFSLYCYHLECPVEIVKQQCQNRVNKIVVYFLNSVITDGWLNPRRYVNLAISYYMFHSIRCVTICDRIDFRNKNEL